MRSIQSSIESDNLTSRPRHSIVAFLLNANAVSFAALVDTTDPSGKSGSGVVSSSSK
jgi:hypothetical protein